MTKNLTNYNFNNLDIRSHIDENNEPWFVGKDVCDVLGIVKYRDALSKLDNDERGSLLVDTLGGQQTMTTVNESGLYALIFKSRKEEAKLFRKWVTSEVLPSIRKNGQYVLDTKIKELQKTISMYKHKDDTLLYDTYFTTSQLGHLTGLGQREIFDRLCNFGLISHTKNSFGGLYTIMPEGQSSCTYNRFGTILINKSMEDYIRNNIAPQPVLLLTYDPRFSVLSLFFT